MKYLKILLGFSLFFHIQCSVSVNFEEDFSGTWDIELIDVLDDWDMPWTQGVGSEAGDDCCGDGNAAIQQNGHRVDYRTTSSLSGNGNYISTLTSDNGDEGIVSGKFTRDNTCSGTYSIEWTDAGGDTRVLSGNWEGTRR